MTTPLQRLLNSDVGFHVVTETLDEFIHAHSHAIIIFTGDPKRRLEAQDIAVVARELARDYAGVRVGIVGLEAEAQLMATFRLDATPSVIFFVDGKRVQTVERLQNWSVYALAARAAYGELAEAS